MNQLFNEYGQKVRANIALNLHPFYLGNWKGWQAESVAGLSQKNSV
jgi:ribosomal protein L31